MIQPLPFIEDLPYALKITQLIYFIAAFIGIYLIGKFAVQPLLKRSLDKRGMDKHVRKPILKSAKWVIIFIALAAAFGFAGLGSFLTSLATIAAAATLAVGFAMQDTMKNFVAGIFIYIDKPFRLGDWIEWDDYSGVVEDISLRVTRVRTFDNELLTVPNSALTDDVIKNPVANDRLRMKFLFGVAYEEDVNEAMDIVLEEAKKTDGIMDEPGPSVLLKELGDSFVGLQSRFWISNPTRSDFSRVRSDYVKSVKNRFDEEGIEMPFPQRDISGEISIKDGESI